LLVPVDDFKNVTITPVNVTLTPVNVDINSKIVDINSQSKVKESKVNKSKVKKSTFGEFVALTDEEYKKLTEQYGPNKLSAMIDILNAYLGSSGRKYQSHYHVLLPLNWVHERFLESLGKDVKARGKPVKDGFADYAEFSL